MSAVYYRPAAALRWLGYKSAERPTERKPAPTPDDIGKRVKKAAEVMWGVGKGAMEDMDKRQAEGVGYTLTDSHVEFASVTGTRRIAYKSIENIFVIENDRYLIEYEGGRHTVKPAAHLVAGRKRVPVGWDRNGTEVPYHLLIEEIAARAGVDIIAA
ncbi:MAG: hypothetical protein KF812_09765 [Fimbriimonadaceae bacterium]|nr:hypothetical protein [Fimbriimonadaceae bacterium]